MSKKLVKLLSKLNKKDIIKLARMKCKCGHSYLEHINCAFKNKVVLETEDGKIIVVEEKVGFLDIEACVTGDTLVLTKNGLKYIKDIKPGEKVLTHKNRWKKVAATSKRQCNGVLYNISPFKMPLLNVTPNHPILVFSPPKSRRGVFDSHSFRYKSFSNPTWKTSKDVQEGDICVSINPDSWVWRDVNKVFVDSAPKADRHKTSNIPSYLPVTDDLLTVIGLFLGDGWSNGVQVVFCANYKDTEFMSILERWFASINASYSKKNSGKMVVYTHCSIQLGKFFQQFYDETKNKYLPLQWLNLPDNRFLEIVHGLILSDGTRYKHKDAIYNTSERLLKEIAVRLMFTDSVSVRAYKYRITRKFDGYTPKPFQYILTVSSKENTHVRRWKVMDYIFYKIVKKTVRKSQEYVYNLQVEEDESYIANGIISHNSNLRADFGVVFSYCIKELDGELITNVVAPQEIRKGMYDKRIMKDLCSDLRKFDKVITFYGSRFDLPFLRTRAVYYGLDFPIYKEVLHQDAYYIVKNRFLLHRNRLETACRFFNIPCKEHPLKPDIWFEAMGGKKKALDYILEHNKEDVISLELLWKKINFYSQCSKRSI